MDLLNTIGVTNTQYVETFTFKQCTICKCILFIYLLPTSSKWLFFIFNIYLEVTNFSFNRFIFFSKLLSRRNIKTGNYHNKVIIDT